MPYFITCSFIMHRLVKWEVSFISDNVIHIEFSFLAKEQCPLEIFSTGGCQPHFQLSNCVHFPTVSPTSMFVYPGQLSPVEKHCLKASSEF